MASGITNNDQKKGLSLHMAGKEVKEIYWSLNSANVEENFDTVIGRLDAYFVPKKNLTYERYMLKAAIDRRFYHWYYKIKDSCRLLWVFWNGKWN